MRKVFRNTVVDAEQLALASTSRRKRRNSNRRSTGAADKGGRQRISISAEVVIPCTGEFVLDCPVGVTEDDADEILKALVAVRSLHDFESWPGEGHCDVLTLREAEPQERTDFVVRRDDKGWSVTPTPRRRT